jgi:hypothetical protein
MEMDRDRQSDVVPGAAERHRAVINVQVGKDLGLMSCVAFIAIDEIEGQQIRGLGCSRSFLA